MEATATIIKTGCNCSLKTSNGSKINLKNKANTAYLAEDASIIVIVVGDPSYTSGAQLWKGNSESLNIIVIMSSINPISRIGLCVASCELQQ